MKRLIAEMSEISKLAKKEFNFRHDLVGKSHLLGMGIAQEIKICPCWKIVYTQTRTRPRKWSPLNFLGLWNTKVPLNLSYMNRQYSLTIRKDLISQWILSFQRIIGENKWKRYFRQIPGFCLRAEKSKNIKVVLILIAITSVVTDPKSLEKRQWELEMRGRV